MKKVLILASVASMIDQFNMPNIELLQNMGYKVEVACNFLEGNTCSPEKIKQLKQILTEKNVLAHQICFARNITKVDANIKAYKQVKKILVENQYEFLHCQSPIGGVIGRLAGHKTKTKVIYTAHGFHFYKGAPWKNWMIYYPIEWLCSYWTDILITINSEDYTLAKKKFKAKRIEYVPGVGIDLNKFSIHYVDSAKKREELNIPNDKLWLLNVGELVTKKNQEVLIRALQDFPDMYLTIVGKGELEEHLKKLIADLMLEDRVELLGFRTDVSELYETCDVFVFSSRQEELSTALLEAMACGKPVVCSAISGNNVLIDENGGELFEPCDVEDLKFALERIGRRNLAELGKYNVRKVKSLDLNSVFNKRNKICDTKILSEWGYYHLTHMIKRYQLRKSFGIGNNDTVLLSVGELNENKNHETAIRAIAGLDVYYLIAGKGDKESRLNQIAKEVGMVDRIKLLGFRDDVDELLKTADIFVFPSYREGLSVSVMEAMASGQPCVVSRIRGNMDLINENGGALFNPYSVEKCKEAVLKIMDRDRRKMGEYNWKKVQDFATKVVLEKMYRIYG